MQFLCRLMLVLAALPVLYADEALNLSVEKSPQGTMEITVDGKSNYHYILYRSLNLAEQGEAIAMELGHDGPVHLKDRFAPMPKQVFYRVRDVLNAESGDTDGDGRLDYDELRPFFFVPDQPSDNPFSPIEKLKTHDGSNLLTPTLWEDFSVEGQGEAALPGRPSGRTHIKFVGMPLHEPGPVVLFMNTKNFSRHDNFVTAISSTYGIPNTGELRGEIVRTADEAGQDWYLFNLNNALPSFELVRLTYHLLTANMPFIDGNLAYRPLDSSLLLFRRDQHFYEREGIPIWVDEDRPGFNDYVSLNQGEAYGLLRVFKGDERPSILDVALYTQLPNDVPLLRGIITETPQTPLSHVNLRAVQNDNPNAYIRGASDHPAIKPLIGKYVRLVVRPKGFEISEVTREEVDARLEALRPKKLQVPSRDLEAREILPLESLGFEWSSSVGAKAANVSELMNQASAIEIPREVFPEMGYAIPFYFYDAFMVHNGFYEEAARMMAAPDFLVDPVTRDGALKEFRRTIKDGDMPGWMLATLTETYNAFPRGQGVRCRSSTNNEDLPGFNGAGLYDSFTHHPDEGHLSKSVKQVYASLWRFLAFEHREFYRVDHFQAAMGVLLHPNYEGELANGVAVSRHEFSNNVYNYPYYANAQVGENLVTNPGILSLPEQLLLSDEALNPLRFTSSNQVPLGEVVMTNEQGRDLGEYLGKIRSHFKRLYNGTNLFAMEIEFKITKDEQLVIKQARPWVN